MDNPISELDRARASFNAANYIEAWQMAARTVIVGPQSFEAWNLLGTLSIKRGEYDHALSHFYRAVRSATVDDPRIAMNLARAQHMSED